MEPSNPFYNLLGGNPNTEKPQSPADNYSALIGSLLASTSSVQSVSSSAPSLASFSAASSSSISSFRPIKKNLYYRNQTIAIDGFVFQNCRFDNCKLEIKNGNFEFRECVIDETCVVSYHGNALKIIKLYNRKDQKRIQDLSPTVNADATINIKA